MGGIFVNYFNRFGRQWQVYVEAEGEYRDSSEKLGSYYVSNQDGAMVPLSALVSVEKRMGPEFTMRYNLYRSAQINGAAAPGYSSDQARAALEDVFSEDHAAGDGLRLPGHVLPGEEGPGGHTPGGDLRPVASLRVPDPGGPLRELVAPVQRPPRRARRGLRRLCDPLRQPDGEQRLRPDRVHHADRALRQERDPDRRVRAYTL